MFASLLLHHNIPRESIFSAKAYSTITGPKRLFCPSVAKVYHARVYIYLRETMLFRNRMHAGQVLAEMLREYGNREDVVVLALPRGGVPVGFEIARALHVPLDVFLVRKLGVPGHEELAMGAIATGGVRVLNEEVVRALELPPEVIDRVTEAERRELTRREAEYRDDRPPPDVRGQ